MDDNLICHVRYQQVTTMPTNTPKALSPPQFFELPPPEIDMSDPEQLRQLLERAGRPFPLTNTIRALSEGASKCEDGNSLPTSA